MAIINNNISVCYFIEVYLLIGSAQSNPTTFSQTESKPYSKLLMVLAVVFCSLFVVTMKHSIVNV